MSASLFPDNEDVGYAFGPIFTAAHESDCASCAYPIEPGEDARSDGQGGWIHADDDCEAIAGVTRARPQETTCSRCFCIHAGECV